MSIESIKQELTIPALGRPFKLGSLYNAHTDELISGFSLWDPENLENVSTTHNSKTTRLFTSISSNKLSDKFRDLDIKGSLLMSCLVGLVPLGVSGSGYVFNKKTNDAPQSSIHVRCQHRTVVKELNMHQLANIPWRDRDRYNATHVVFKIQYGADTTFTLSKQFESEEDNDVLQAGANEFVKAIVEGEKGGDRPASSSTTANTKIQCEFEGDFSFFNVKTPNTLEEAMQFSREFTKHLSDSIAKDPAGGNEPLGVPKTVYLYPLDKLLMQNPGNAQHITLERAIQKEVNPIDTFELVRIMEDFIEVEEMLMLILNDPLVKRLTPFYKKLKEYQQHLTVFQEEFKRKLEIMVLEMRSCEAEQPKEEHIKPAKDLLQYIKDDQFTFSKKNLERWLIQKTEELSIIERFQDKITKEMQKLKNSSEKVTASNSNNPENILLFPDKTELQNQMVSDSSIQFGFEISLWPLLKSQDAFLGQAKNVILKISNGDIGNLLETERKENNNDGPNWYKDQVVLNKIEKDIEVFVKLIKENANNPADKAKFAFALTAIEEDNIHQQATVINGPALFIYNKSGMRLHGSDALHYLCEHYQQNNWLLLDIVTLLLDQADIVNSTNAEGWNALLLLCRHYQNDNLLEIVQLLVDKGIDINCKIENDWNALHLVCKHYNNIRLIDVVRLLIGRGIDVNYLAENENNVLVLLCHHYNKNNLLEIVGLFLGANNTNSQIQWKLSKILFNKNQWWYSLKMLLRYVWKKICSFFSFLKKYATGHKHEKTIKVLMS